MLYRIVHEVASPLGLQGEALAGVNALVARCLEKQPGRRPQAAGEVAAALAELRERLDEAQRGLVMSETVRVARP